MVREEVRLKLVSKQESEEVTLVPLLFAIQDYKMRFSHWHVFHKKTSYVLRRICG